jgi:phosphoribosylanthranilate isomerase
MLDLISFVGIDTKTDLNTLVSFDKESEAMFQVISDDMPPYIEYGFLYSEKRSLTNDLRYPDIEFIKEAKHMLSHNMLATSVHLCGEEAIQQYLDASDEIMELIQDSRVQLNFNMKNYREEELIETVLRVSDLHDLPLILQCNKSKSEFIKKLMKRMNLKKLSSGIMPNIDILYDASGGFGREIEYIQKPFQGVRTGYAGGLKPANIQRVLGLIDGVLEESGEYFPYYLDMESGIRVNNEFCIGACGLVIIEACDYLKKFNR